MIKYSHLIGPRRLNFLLYILLKVHIQYTLVCNILDNCKLCFSTNIDTLVTLCPTIISGFAEFLVIPFSSNMYSEFCPIFNRVAQDLSCWWGLSYSFLTLLLSFLFYLAQKICICCWKSYQSLLFEISQYCLWLLYCLFCLLWSECLCSLQIHNFKS